MNLDIFQGKLLIHLRTAQKRLVLAPAPLVASWSVQVLKIFVMHVHQAPTTRLMTKQAKAVAFHAVTGRSLLSTEPLRANPAPLDGAAHLVVPAAHQQSPSSRAPFRSLPFNLDPSRPSTSSSFTLDRTQSHGTLIPPRCHHGSTSARSLGLSLEAIR